MNFQNLPIKQEAGKSSRAPAGQGGVEQLQAATQARRCTAAPADRRLAHSTARPPTHAPSRGQHEQGPLPQLRQRLSPAAAGLVLLRARAAASLRCLVLRPACGRRGHTAALGPLPRPLALAAATAATAAAQERHIWGGGQFQFTRGVGAVAVHLRRAGRGRAAGTSRPWRSAGQLCGSTRVRHHARPVPVPPPHNSTTSGPRARTNTIQLRPADRGIQCLAGGALGRRLRKLVKGEGQQQARQAGEAACGGGRWTAVGGPAGARASRRGVVQARAEQPKDACAACKQAAACQPVPHAARNGVHGGLMWRCL